MASLVTSLATCIVTSTTWCFCSACGSLLSSCCGNDKPSTVAPGPTSGRKRSVLLFLLSLGLSLGFQYGLAPFFVTSWQVATITTYFQDTWIDGCERYERPNNDGGENDNTLLIRCASNNGNFRVAAATTFFFIIAALAVICKPTANREAWPAKYVLYLFLVAVTIPIPSDPWFSSIYLNIARVGGIVFILVQQIIILDVAYNWNDKWVENSNRAEVDEGPGAGNKWLTAIMVSCVGLFTAALGGIIAMYIFYSGCSSNNAFITLTLGFCILVTAAQLSGEEGSLLASACISSWAVFLCYSAVTKNPNEQCNPSLADMDWLKVFLGVTITLISLCWVAWSYTAEDSMVLRRTDDTDGDREGTSDNNKPAVTGIVIGDNYGTTNDGEGDKNESSSDTNEQEVDRTKLSNSWRLNVALASIVCWTSMVLTDWGAIQASGEIANAATGQTAMWMIMAAQWIVLTLYTWTLIAPRVFPDRDFS